MLRRQGGIGRQPDWPPIFSTSAEHGGNAGDREKRMSPTLCFVMTVSDDRYIRDMSR
jgi:hypothetical protein